jgi:large subunit ribosomal protein L10
MSTENKIKIVKNLTERISFSNCFYIVDSNGLTAEQISYFRRLCFNNKLYYCVIKNTLIKKSFKILNKKGLCPDLLNNILKGFSAILVSKSISNVPAKVIIDFRKYKNVNLPMLKCAFVDDELFIGNDSLHKLSTIKSKEESISYIILLLKSPLSNLFSLLNSNDKLLSIMKALSNK